MRPAFENGARNVNGKTRVISDPMGTGGPK
jgi:hypothetical protein